jgi:peptide/nickel transport system permease protein
MSDRKLIWGAGFLGLVSLAAIAAPWIGLRDPATQPDGLVLRDLPPFSRVEAIALADGGLLYAHEIDLRSDGSVAYRRGERWSNLAREELSGSGPEDWHREPVFVLGTDGFGRDLLSRLVFGARVSLLIGLTAAAMAMVVGAAMGLASGLAGGWIDAVLMRFTDLVLSVPRLFLALMLVALYGASMTTTVFVLAGTTWMAAARLVRGEILSARENEYVQAARAAGVPTLRMGLFHLLPAVLTPLLVEGTLRVGDTILLETALSFLGLGVPPPAASWGNLIADGRSSLLDAWWIATLPGLAIAATVIALNMLGDGARDRFDGSRRSRARPGLGAACRGSAGRLVPATGRLLSLSALLLIAGQATASSPSPVHLTAERDSRSARIVARNSATYPVTVTLELTERDNVTSDQAFPVTATVPAGGKRVLVSLEQGDHQTPWSYRYRWTWAEGSREAIVDADAPDVTTGTTTPREGPDAYTLPYRPGFAFQISQGQDDDPSHSSPHAIDWLMPAGTQVTATRDGAVASHGGSHGALRILHFDGTIGTYLGLEGIRVRLGDPVEVGDALGIVADKGEFASPHLHFHVTGVDTDGSSRVVPLTFDTSSGEPETLVREQVYMRPYDEPGKSPNGGIPLNAVRSLVTCRRVDRSGNPLDKTSRFSSDDVVHVHVAFGAPDTYPIRVEFLKAGETDPESIRQFPTQPGWDGVDLTLDLSGVPDPKGDWVVRALIGDDEQARTEFRVGE